MYSLPRDGFVLNRLREGENRWPLWLAAGTAIAALAGLLSYLFLRRRRTPTPPVQTVPELPDLRQHQGLSEAEARARLTVDLDELQSEQLKRSRQAIFERNARSWFNFTLIGLAFIQWFLDDRLGALITVGIILLNIVINTAQQMISIRRVKALAAQSSPKATVIRDGKVKSIDPIRIVEGDLVAIGPGDEILAEGQVISEASLQINQKNGQAETSSRLVGSGEWLSRGNFCTDGRGVYQVSQAPADQLTQELTTDLGLIQKELTPLQIIINRILQIMIALVILFLIPFLLHLVNVEILTEEIQTAHRDIASIIFSIAPSGLFFMIIVTYATGSADIARLGALVRDSLAVETLSQINVLCFDKADTLTGLEVRLSDFQRESSETILSETRIRQVLSDYAASSAGTNRLFTILQASLEGHAREIEEENPFFSIYGWCGVTFSDPDVKGTYVIGVPDLIQERVVAAPLDEQGEGDPEKKSEARRLFGRLRGVFTRNAEDEAQINKQGGANELKEGAEAADEKTDPAGATSRPGLFARIRAVLPGGGKDREPAGAGDGQPDRDDSPVQLTFAYSPEPQPLIDPLGHPVIPSDLLPLCVINISERVRSDAAEIIQEFLAIGVRVKILSSDTREKVVSAAGELGLSPGPEVPQPAITGPEIDLLKDDELSQISESTDLFAQLNSDQKVRVIRSLQQRGQLVGIVAGQLGTVQAMAEADLRITKRGGSQAAFSMAEIVLLEDSLEALSAVLLKGQKIVNGLLDILRLNITQIGTIALLLLVMLILRGESFVINSSQSGMIAFFTVVLPSIGLTLWAEGGAVPRRTMAQRLTHFILPATAAISLAIVLLSLYFIQAYSKTDVQFINTYAMIVLGLLLVLFVQPPGRFWVGGDVYSGDLRPTILAMISFALYNLVMLIPLAQELLKIQHLPRVEDYLIVAVTAAIWAFILRGFWRFRLVQIGTERFSNLLAGDFSNPSKPNRV